MNRSIKFRAWDVSDKEMKLPTKLHLSRSTPFTNDNNSGAVTHINCNGQDHINIFNGGFILMQYIGQKDKNDKEIYEGDWIDTGHGIGFIVWFGTGWGIESPGSEAVDSFWESEMYEWEVVGNIYEHPHLPNSEQNQRGSVATESEQRTQS
jgi:hypothetical protein